VVQVVLEIHQQHHHHKETMVVKQIMVHQDHLVILAVEVVVQAQLAVMDLLVAVEVMEYLLL
jgi:hypothetical protein